MATRTATIGSAVRIRLDSRACPVSDFSSRISSARSRAPSATWSRASATLEPDRRCSVATSATCSMSSDFIRSATRVQARPPVAGRAARRRRPARTRRRSGSSAPSVTASTAPARLRPPRTAPAMSWRAGGKLVGEACRGSADGAACSEAHRTNGPRASPRKNPTTEPRTSVSRTSATSEPATASLTRPPASGGSGPRRQPARTRATTAGGPGMAGTPGLAREHQSRPIRPQPWRRG